MNTNQFTNLIGERVATQSGNLEITHFNWQTQVDLWVSNLELYIYINMYIISVLNNSVEMSHWDML